MSHWEKIVSIVELDYKITHIIKKHSLWCQVSVQARGPLVF